MSVSVCVRENERGSQEVIEGPSSLVECRIGGGGWVNEVWSDSEGE